MTFKFKCSAHIGDHIFTLWFLNAAAQYWPHHHFSLWIGPNAFDEIRRLARKVPNLEVTDREDGHTIECWMGRDQFYHHFRQHGRFLEFMAQFHAYLCRKHGLPEWPMKNKLEMLLPADSLDDAHALKDEAFDVMFINSAALSGQCGGWDQERVHEMARKCATSGFKTVVTHPCGLDIPTTLSLGLKLNQLGELASRCKIVAGVANAPILATFNEKAFQSVRHWIGYSCDRVNFDDQRVSWAYSPDELELALAAQLRTL